MLPWIMLFAVAGSVGALGGAAVLLLFPDRVRQVLVPCILSYATGTLLAAAFLGMLPRGAEDLPVADLLVVVLAGIVGFFLLEKLVIWRHCHDGDCDVHVRAARLILIGDAVHNFVDGVVIAAAFVASFPLGIAVAVAVIAHEVPQEIGDFAILLESGLSRSRAFLYNLLSSTATLPGALIGYFWLAEARALLPYCLGVAAASFIYIAIADLVPGLHREVRPAAALRQVALIGAGIATIAILS